jgi:hypothetical protein
MATEATLELLSVNDHILECLGASERFGEIYEESTFMELPPGTPVLVQINGNLTLHKSLFKHG